MTVARWPRCRFRYSWNEHYTCDKRVLWRYCFDHWMDGARWEWKLGRLGLRVDLSNLNRPELWTDRDRPPWTLPESIELAYGNDGCDPAVAVSLRLRRPSDTPAFAAPEVVPSAANGPEGGA